MKEYIIFIVYLLVTSGEECHFHCRFDEEVEYVIGGRICHFHSSIGLSHRENSVSFSLVDFLIGRKVCHFHSLIFLSGEKCHFHCRLAYQTGWKMSFSLSTGLSHREKNVMFTVDWIITLEEKYVIFTVHIIFGKGKM